MPTYDYKCKECSSVQEEFHSISSNLEIKCKVCNIECEKIFSSEGNFVLKGDGWPSQSSRIKSSMTKKNKKLRTKMIDREKSNEAVNKMSDLKN